MPGGRLRRGMMRARTLRGGLGDQPTAPTTESCRRHVSLFSENSRHFILVTAPISGLWSCHDSRPVRETAPGSGYREFSNNSIVENFRKSGVNGGDSRL